MLPPPSIEGNAAEAQTLDIVENARTFRREMGLAGPVLISVALLHANLMKFGSERILFQTGRTFDRDVVVLPDVLMEDEAPVHSTLRVVFDSLAGSRFEGKSELRGGRLIHRRPRSLGGAWDIAGTLRPRCERKLLILKVQPH